MQSIKIKNRLFLGIADRMMQLRNGETMDDFMLSMLLNSKLREWHKDNAIRLRALSEKINKLRKEHFVFEVPEGQKDEVMKMETKPTIPAVPAKYDTKTIVLRSFLGTGLFKETKEEQVEVSPAIPEQNFQPEPVCLEGKTIAGYNEEYNKILEEENDLVF